MLRLVRRFCFGGSASGKLNERCFALFFKMTALALLVGGTVMIVVGEVTSNELAAKSADEEFKRMSSACEISDVKVTRESHINQNTDNNLNHHRGSGYSCLDRYEFSFIYEGQEYAGRADYDPHWEVVCSDACSACSDEKTEAKWKVGEKLDCWKPTIDQEELHAAYKCPNDKCVKIDDPAEDLENASMNYGLMVLAGILVTCIGCCVGCVACCAMKNEKETTVVFTEEYRASEGATEPTTMLEAWSRPEDDELWQAPGQLTSAVASELREPPSRCPQPPLEQPEVIGNESEARMQHENVFLPQPNGPPPNGRKGSEECSILKW